MAAQNATALEKIQAYLDAINHMVIFAVTVYITFMCWYVGPTARSWHMWLCTMGVSIFPPPPHPNPRNPADPPGLVHFQYQLLMAEGILAFYASNGWSRLHGRRTKSHLHWILQVVGAGMSIAGCVIEYYDNTRHLRSIHSLLGLISLAFLCVSLLNGVSAMWSPQLRAWLRPVFTKSVHNLCGLLAFVVGMVSQLYGYDTGRVVRASTPEIRVALQIAAAVTIVLSTFGALKSLCGQLRDMFGVDALRLPSWWCGAKKA